MGKAECEIAMATARQAAELPAEHRAPVAAGLVPANVAVPTSARRPIKIARGKGRGESCFDDSLQRLALSESGKPPSAAMAWWF
jgi:hypothetical protein